MGMHGYPLLSVDIQWYPLISMDIQGFPQICMCSVDIHGYHLMHHCFMRHASSLSDKKTGSQIPSVASCIIFTSCMFHASCVMHRASCIKHVSPFIMNGDWDWSMENASCAPTVGIGIRQVFLSRLCWLSSPPAHQPWRMMPDPMNGEWSMKDASCAPTAGIGIRQFSLSRWCWLFCPPSHPPTTVHDAWPDEWWMDEAWWMLHVHPPLG